MGRLKQWVELIDREVWKHLRLGLGLRGGVVGSVLVATTDSAVGFGLGLGSGLG